MPRNPEQPEKSEASAFEARMAKLSDRQRIRELQDQNYVENLSEEEKREGGFIGIRFDDNELKKLIEDPGIVVVQDAGTVVGYLSFTTLDKAREIADLEPFFERVKDLRFEGKDFSEYRSLFLEQISIDKRYKGKGIPKLLYEKLKQDSKDRYDIAVSEISDLNQRSLHVARDKLGFKIIDTYDVPEREETGEGKTWHAVALDLRSPERE